MEPILEALEAPRLDDEIDDVVGELPLSIAVLRGPELVHEFATPAYCRLVGREDVRGCRNRDLGHHLIAKTVEHVYRTGRAHVDHELSLVFDRRRDGRLTRGYFDISVRPRLDAAGRTTGVAVVATEITRHVESRIAAEVKHAEAERHNRAKDDFLAIASHELRNPLMAILGWTRRLRTEQASRAQTERSLERIELNAMTQSKLIDDLLDAARITGGRLCLELRDVDLGAIVQGVLESCRPAIESNQLRLEVDLERELPSILGDGPRLQQVVWNLVTNAVKFTPHGGRILIRLRRDQTALELSVADDGDGIPSAMLEAIFERFKQCDPGSPRSKRGLGLGLWISRDIVELHGGTICAHSDGIGRGATFLLRLPFGVA